MKPRCLLSALLVVALLCSIALVLSCSTESQDDDDSDDDDDSGDDDDDSGDDDDEGEWSPGVTGDVDVADHTKVIPDDVATQATVTDDKVTFPLKGNESLKDIVEGDVIVSGYQNGFLRWVRDVEIKSDKIIFSTEQATLVDLFDYADVQMEIPLTDGKSWLEWDLADTVVFKGKVNGVYVSVELSDGKLTLDPILVGDFLWDGFELKRFSFGVGAAYSLTADAEVTVGGEIATPFKDEAPPIVLGIHPIPILIAGVPVVIVIENDVVLGFEVQCFGEVAMSGGLEVHSNFTAGVLYNEGKWSGIWEQNSNYGMHDPTFDARVGWEFKTYLRLEEEFKLYGIVGPYWNVGPVMKFEQKFNPACTWALKAGLEANAGAKVELLWEELADYEVRLYSSPWVDLGSGDCGDDDDDDDDDEIFIPAGTFYMGCEPNDTQCSDSEKPRHQVFLSAYYIDTYAVTNHQYAYYLNNINPSNNCSGYSCVYSTHPDDLGLYESGGIWYVDPTYENRPVVYVSWYGAKEYCEARGERLPTEAEWEKAAKGASQHYIYPWGDTWISNAANYWNQGDPYEAGTYPWTTPVGYFDGSNHGGAYQTTDGRSPYGAHDMVGNVWEWVNDWWNEDYYSQTPPGGWIDPQGPSSGPSRCVHGGSWIYGDLVAYRNSVRYVCNSWPDCYFNECGFRCARDAE